ncbi:flavin-containing monooxygenase [Streptomyces sp. NPDC058001]|uniref:flavin-containing monooxygenase n=1 Tax=Streptomyces sp. NPDC058001 TaxID=3346300 RepID=UPI0036E93E5C
MDNRASAPDVDAVVIGAGFSGLYATKRLRDIGLDVRSFDDGHDVGGVWQWNAYPGALTDSLHEAYQFSFDEELAREWSFSHIHPDRNEVLSYLRLVAERYDLRKHYTLSTRVESAVFDESANRWTFTTDAGETLTATYFVTGLGLVSAPIFPDVPGIDSFRGEIHHTSRWPQDKAVDFAGKRVAVIGTGSSGVQIIPVIAEQAAELAVFQRTPNWVAPTGNRPVTEDEKNWIADNQDLVWGRVRQHPAGWPWEMVARSALDTPEAEREQIFTDAWATGGFSMLYETFGDLSTDKSANDLVCAWMAKKIRSTVHDPAVAEKLIPHHPYGAKRPPASDGYHQAFNKPTVRLVDLTDTPIVALTPDGIRTADGEQPFDVIVVATGFDAITGAFTRMDIRGVGGASLNDAWIAGPQTYLGLAVNGFPNMFMVAGPQSPFANLPPGAQEQGNWIADLITHMRENGVALAQPTRESEIEWTKHLNEVAESLVTRYGLEANSWFAGANIEGKARAFNVYFGGANVHADLCDTEAAAGYPHFEFTGSAADPA